MYYSSLWDIRSRLCKFFIPRLHLKSLNCLSLFHKDSFESYSVAKTFKMISFFFFFFFSLERNLLMILKQPSGQYKSMTIIEIRFTVHLHSRFWWKFVLHKKRRHLILVLRQLCRIHHKLVGEKVHSLAIKTCTNLNYIVILMLLKPLFHHKNVPDMSHSLSSWTKTFF